MRNKIMLAVTLLLAAATVSGCYDHPGHDGDRHGGHHRGDHGGDNDHRDH